MFRSLPMLLAVLLAAAPATAQVGIGPTVSATGPNAAIGVPQENIGDLLPRWLGDVSIESVRLEDGADATRARVPVVLDGRFRLLPD
ncbi:MAG: hypothetical protein IPI87_02715 [Betaproteobacteria bacterium]|nr:hypothetical protein [Betaproteobacteria bacterium]